MGQILDYLPQTDLHCDVKELVPHSGAKERTSSHTVISKPQEIYVKAISESANIYTSRDIINYFTF